MYTATQRRSRHSTYRLPCRSFTPQRDRQLRKKDLPKVHKWRQERDSNPQLCGRKVSTLPMSIMLNMHRTPLFIS